MSNVLIVSSVSKRYASYKSNMHRFATWFGASIEPVSEYWATRDVSFEVKAGEALALIGQNGAGKSTLLKMITGTVRPTSGDITVYGRISAILELGLGFNPEFSGRQNIYNAGGLMGFSQDELRALMPSIETFAEIGDFFDQPIRVYSSGMQARLAFALATAKRPDVLIVDEVLSVGDSYFQHKSFDKIRQFKDQGSSIILVTHSLGDVRALCDRVILLDKGKVLRDGLPDEVVDYYNAMIADRENAKASGGIEQVRGDNGWMKTRSGTLEISISKLVLLDEDTRAEVSVVRAGQRLLLRLEASTKAMIPSLVLGYMLRDRTGHLVWGTNTWHTKQIIHDLEAGQIVVYETHFTCSLGPGSYSFSPALVASDTHLEKNYEWQDNALVFDVVNTDHDTFVGTNFLDAKFVISRVQ
ncbi:MULTISPECIES: ABC transporter ATP-binding protein [unclassified Rhizobium]|uniref:ABC transporter ATP-binding protein n=1 Tax=unclassified Rhizobium TaxID=2613769 RepID=UPI0011602C93|nr:MULTISPECIES: ABC transporter ATP-binding protein [unclassified Rhizobium]TQX86909.1 ABC transporter ATP-binding protein [Rhizobium sp. rho-13.1]TQY08688.1 ABC transporter ATP-binding protein [Rhizobium sp. rho-1.1]